MNGDDSRRRKQIARMLRRNMTREERRLWYDFLKTLPVTVHRQKVIGPYIADFYIAKAKLVVELDGSQHDEDAARMKDKVRDAFFQKEGLRVLRFSNLDVMQNFSGVCQSILMQLPSSLLPGGEGAPKGRMRGTAQKTGENTSSVADATASPRGEAIYERKMPTKTIREDASPAAGAIDSPEAGAGRRHTP